MRRVSVVSYLNSLPYLEGLKTFLSPEQWEISVDPPGEIARKLSQGLTDIGLVPVAAIPGIDGAHVITPYGIAADGPVNSVFLFSQNPLHELENIYLDFESRTSVALVRLLARDLWKTEWKFLPALDGFEAEIHGRTGGVIIGDRAIRALGKFGYRYDLSDCWRTLTGLPFVFARWVSRVDLSAEELTKFCEALEKGLEMKDLLLQNLLESREWDHDFVRKYLNESILYKINASAEAGMSLFLERGGDFFSRLY
jgi:chorismate dehydratase